MPVPISKSKQASFPTTQDGYSSDTEISLQNATQRYFLRTRDSTWKYEKNRRDISNKMLWARASAQEQTIALTGLPARVLLSAENSLYPILFPNPPTGDYHTNHRLVPKKTSQDDRGNQAATEAIQINSKDGTAFTIMTYRQAATSLHVNHAGNYFFASLGTYAEICDQLSELKGRMQLPNTAGEEQNPTNLMKEKDKKLATFLLGYGKNLYSLRKEVLQAALSLSEILPEDQRLIDTLCYNLFVKEITRRLNPRDAMTHDLPFASSLVRALKLVEAGHITLKDFLHPDGELATFTVPRVGINIGIAKRNIKRINQLYAQHFPDEAKHPLRFKKELAKGFGGLSDSDDDGYMRISSFQGTGLPAVSVAAKSEFVTT